MAIGNLQKGSEQPGGRREGPGRQAGLAISWYIAFARALKGWSHPILTRTLARHLELNTVRIILTVLEMKKT